MTGLLRPILWAVMMAHQPAAPTPAVAPPAIVAPAPTDTTGDGPQPVGPSVTIQVQDGNLMTAGVNDADTPQPVYECDAVDAAQFVWCSNFDGTW